MGRQYQKAYERALLATSTKAAPWYVIPANDKLHRNLMIAELIVSHPQRQLNITPPKAQSGICRADH